MENNNEILELCVPEKIMNPNNVSTLQSFVVFNVQPISFHLIGLVFKKRFHLTTWRLFFNTNMFTEMFTHVTVSVYEHVLKYVEGLLQ